jgi:predicted dithiol-disulfide oxidoreductase (DUF899 family)
MGSSSQGGNTGWRVDNVEIVDGFDCATTAVGFAGLTARASTRGVLVRWRSTGVSRFLGFDVFRQTGSGRVRLNPSPIAATGPARTYSYLDRQPRGRRSGTYWIRAVRLDGSRTWYGPVHASQ